MSLEYLVFANILLIPRLLYLGADGPMPRARLVAMTLAQCLLVALALDWNWALAVGVVIIIGCNAFEGWYVDGSDRATSWRLTSLLLLLLVPAYLATWLGGFVLSGAMPVLISHLCETLPLLQALCRADAAFLGTLLFGLLLLANESNMLIRAVFHYLGLEPRQESAAGDRVIDAAEYSAGRAIGILERWLMLIVVLWSDDLSALAFIIAAKGLARFKQLDDRQFAEYMLVGTLLSALAAIAVGAAIKHL